MAKVKDTLSYPKGPKDLARMKDEGKKNDAKRSENQRRVSEAAKKKSK